MAGKQQIKMKTFGANNPAKQIIGVEYALS